LTMLGDLCTKPLSCYPIAFSDKYITAANCRGFGC
jgi:hypothetical protein